MNKVWTKAIWTGAVTMMLVNVRAQKLRFYRTTARVSKGTVVFFPDGQPAGRQAAEQSAETFRASQNGYDVVLLDYSINAGKKSHDLAVADGLKAFRLLNQKKIQPMLSGERLIVVGAGKGGHAAAEVVRRLGAGEQPSDLLLLNPSQMDEKMPGTVLPAVRPPVHPEARLILVLNHADSSVLQGAIVYAKTWEGYDGEMFMVRIGKEKPATQHDTDETILKWLLRPRKQKATGENPAEVAVAGDARERHKEKTDSVTARQYDLLMIGNSITNNFDKPEYQGVWHQFFGSRNAINLGYSGYRTENILWNLDSGELTGQNPRVAVIERRTWWLWLYFPGRKIRKAPAGC